MTGCAGEEILFGSSREGGFEKMRLKERRGVRCLNSCPGEK